MESPTHRMRSSVPGFTSLPGAEWRLPDGAGSVGGRPVHICRYANPRPDPKVECHAGSGCDDYKCPEGKEPRCPVLGGPATGYCQCFAKSSAQSRIFALLSGQNSTHPANSTLSRGARRNSTPVLQDSTRNASVIRHQKLS
ncbi:hypothetical protein PG996_004086 [Apiospora saccharicola]|uniref:Uncharacterized protein n=1 Tax=Apiospora saccharicola TaxID=335842 RepID=A0ABR1W5U6_9PEZI